MDSDALHVGMTVAIVHVVVKSLPKRNGGTKVERQGTEANKVSNHDKPSRGVPGDCNPKFRRLS